jgi:hypothetical protein
MCAFSSVPDIQVTDSGFFFLAGDPWGIRGQE